MKRTIDAYLRSDSVEELCDSCKHSRVELDKEPCKSCVISNWEPMKEDEEK